MKVAQVCGNFPPELRGGMEMVVGALSRALVEIGVEVTIIAGSEALRADGGVSREQWHGIPVFRLHRTVEESHPTQLQRPRIRAMVEELLVSERVDVLHSHHMASLSADLLRAGRARGLGTLFTFHDQWAACARFFRQPPVGVTCPSGAGRDECVGCIDREMRAGAAAVRQVLQGRDDCIRREITAAGRLTAPSHSCADGIRRHLPWTPAMPEIEVLPHGLLRSPTGGRKPASGAAPFRIGTFGNLVAAKGVEDLVRAAAGLQGAEVHLAGAFLEPEFEQQLRRLAAELQVALVYRGAYDETPPHPAEDLDLAVFPSRCEESYGLVVDEALSRGVPVVVSDRGAFGERRGQGGVQVVSGGPEELAASLAELVADADRYAALAAAVPERFPTIAAAAERYRELYREVSEEER